MTVNMISAEQAAQRLGVKLQTVYAYVSRGLLTRELDADGRKSRFSAAQVEQLAQRGRPRHEQKRIGTVDVSLVSGISALQPEGLLAYRGYDVQRLCDAASFESVVELLWTGELPHEVRWPRSPGKQHPARRAAAELPEGSSAPLRFALTTAALACTQPLRFDLRPAAVLGHARLLLTTLVEALPLQTRSGERAGAAQTVAARLWPRLSPRPLTTARAQLLDSALILLADHELATSTLAARVAASTRADPFAVVLAGLGALSGPLHGRAALHVQELLLSAHNAPSPEAAVGVALSSGRPLPGLGHPVYRTRDPRAEIVLARLTPLLEAPQRMLIDRVLRAARSAPDAPAPNIDFALGALAYASDMPLGATEAIFALARTAGFIAHALEEYGEAPLRFRGRALYDGPAPGSRMPPRKR